MKSDHLIHDVLGQLWISQREPQRKNGATDRAGSHPFVRDEITPDAFQDFTGWARFSRESRVGSGMMRVGHLSNGAEVRRAGGAAASESVLVKSGQLSLHEIVIVQKRTLNKSG